MDNVLANLRRERSKKDFPELHLQDGEYVEIALKRSKMCQTAVWSAVIFGVIVISLVFLLVVLSQDSMEEMGRNFMTIIFITMLAAVVVMGLFATIVNRGNRLYITNKRAMQMIMHSPVSTSMNIIDLCSVEDASFRQENLTQKLFKFGTLRLSTVGDETTYTFPYCDVTPEELDRITKLISDSKKKNRRPGKDTSSSEEEDVQETTEATA